MKGLLTLFLFTSLSFAQTQEPRILEIRNLYNKTQSELSTFNTKTIDDLENSSEGGELTKYETKLGIRLIRTKYYGSIGKSITEYYYQNDQVYFVFKTDYQYNAPPTQPEYDDSRTEIAESRFYFEGPKLIRWITQDGKHQNLELPKAEEERKNQLELAKQAWQAFQ